MKFHSVFEFNIAINKMKKIKFNYICINSNKQTFSSKV